MVPARPDAFPALAASISQSTSHGKVCAGAEASDVVDLLGTVVPLGTSHYVRRARWPFSYCHSTDWVV